MSRKEADAAYNAAEEAKQLYIPFNLILGWSRLKDDSETIPLYVARLRELAIDESLDDPRTQAWHLSILIELMVRWFERLVKSGQLDPVLPRLASLPILYSPLAGKGATRWKRAKALYDAKKVGSEGLGKHRGQDPDVSRGSVWGELAECGVHAARIVAQQLPLEIQPRLKTAVAYCRIKWAAPRAKIPIHATVYLLDDGGVLYLQNWVPLCAGLSEKSVTDDLARYKRIVRAMLDDFFATPGNRTSADELLNDMVQGAGKESRAYAVKEARKRILACVGRL